MTGSAPDTTKVYGNRAHFRQNPPNLVTLGELFRRNGYFAASVGNIVHYDNPMKIGTDGLDGPVTDYTYDPSGVDHPKDEPLVTNFTPDRTAGVVGPLGSTLSFYSSPAQDDEITDGIGTKEVIRLLGGKRQEPFFIAFGLYRPHVPWIVPSRYFAQYPIDTIRANPFDPSELKIAPPPGYWTQPPNFGMNERQRREAIRGYYAATTFMDGRQGPHSTRNSS
jgi:iduronate 2-sulfatase